MPPVMNIIKKNTARMIWEKSFGTPEARSTGPMFTSNTGALTKSTMVNIINLKPPTLLPAVSLFLTNRFWMP